MTDKEQQFYLDMFYAMEHHRYWLAQVLEKPRHKDEHGTVHICCQHDFIDELIKVRDEAETKIQKALGQPITPPPPEPYMLDMAKIKEKLDAKKVTPWVKRKRLTRYVGLIYGVFQSVLYCEEYAGAYEVINGGWTLHKPKDGEWMNDDGVRCGTNKNVGEYKVILEDMEPPPGGDQGYRDPSMPETHTDGCALIVEEAKKHK